MIKLKWYQRQLIKNNKLKVHNMSIENDESIVNDSDEEIKSENSFKGCSIKNHMY